MSGSLLRLEQFSVRFRQRLILDRVTMTLREHEIFALMGPGGAGKSTLLRTISGLNDSLDYMETSGSATYLGRPLARADVRPELIQQRLELSMLPVRDVLLSNLPERSTLSSTQQRETLLRVLDHNAQLDLRAVLEQPLLELPRVVQQRVMIVRASMSSPHVICVDEPTAGLPEAEAEQIMALLRRQRESRAVILVTHHQGHARQISDRCALLAGGRIIEVADAEVFFTSPAHALTRNYIRTGGCSVPSLEADREALNEEGLQLIEELDALAANASLDAEDELELELALPPARDVHIPHAAPRVVIPEWRGPTGFRWMRPGVYGGTPQPGMFTPMVDDLDALARLRVTHLVTLTEAPIHVQHMAAFDAVQITPIFFPIEDMLAPEIEACASLCEHIDQLTREGATVAFHCKAGIGRTGTMLAAMLVWEGVAAEAAIAHVRHIEPRWIQSTPQERFLGQLAQWLSTHAASREVCADLVTL